MLEEAVHSSEEEHLLMVQWVIKLNPYVRFIGLCFVPAIALQLEYKLMYGMIVSIKSFVSRISPYDMKEGFQSFKTNKYKLHFYETPTGLKFIMNTDLNVPNIKDVLQQIYSSIYVEYVIKNPFHVQGSPITSELFKTKLDEYIRNLAFFSSKVS